MASDSATVRELLTFTLDGEWGLDPSAAHPHQTTEMRIIRGTDFDSVSAGGINSVPIRAIRADIAVRKALQEDDVLIETAGGSARHSTGRVCRVTRSMLRDADRPVTCASFARFLRFDKSKINPEFAYWALQDLYLSGLMAEHQVQHTGIARFQFTKFAESQSLCIPDVSQQQGIVDLMSALQEKIQALTNQSSTLELTARAIFKSWFVDFDPVRMKAEGRDLDGINTAVARLFPEGLENSSMGDKPVGWDSSTIGEHVRIGRGASPRPIQDYMNGEIPWVKIADATSGDGTFIFTTREHVTLSGALKSVPVCPGDLVMSNSASCGIPVFIELHGCIHDGWLYFRDYQSITKSYLYYWLMHISSHLIHIADGSVQKNLNTTLVASQPLLVPPPRIMEHFDQIANSILNRMKLNAEIGITLGGLRDTLLPRLIAGKLRVSEAEKLVEAVL